MIIPFFLVVILFSNSDCHSVIQTRRSIRRFTQDSIPLSILTKICDDARLAPSPGNCQPWEFIVVTDSNVAEEIFNHLEWLGEPPTVNEKPTAYIVVLIPKDRQKDWSIIASFGACCQNILLSSWAQGIGSCWIGSIKEHNKLKKVLKIPKDLEIFSIIALGYPKEKPTLEEFKDTTTPYRNSDGKIYIPKKALKQILHLNQY